MLPPARSAAYLLTARVLPPTVNRILDELSLQYSKTIPPWALTVPQHLLKVNGITRLNEIKEKTKQEPVSGMPDGSASNLSTERMNSNSTTSDLHPDTEYEAEPPSVSELTSSESQPSDSEFSDDYRVTDSEEEDIDFKPPYAKEHTQALSQIKLLLNQHQGTVPVQNEEIHQFLLNAAQVSPTKSQDCFLSTVS